MRKKKAGSETGHSRSRNKNKPYDPLSQISTVWTYIVSSEEENLVKIIAAMSILYELHGKPFGPSSKAINIWLEYGQATTKN